MNPGLYWHPGVFDMRPCMSSSSDAGESVRSWREPSDVGGAHRGVIDKNRNAFRRLPERFTGRAVLGFGFDRDQPRAGRHPRGDGAWPL